MPRSLFEDEQRLPADKEHVRLTDLLQRKLFGIPPHHLPTLSLSDIVHETPRALHLPNIPPDIQLAFFLRNRALIDRNAGKPVKDEEVQSLDLTRSIWYYRLDAARQFQRYHDTARWNIALFSALLTLSSNATPPSSSQPGSLSSNRVQKDPLSRDTYIPPAARRFMTSYLAAVLEHHNTPMTFERRDALIRLWKNGIWDVFETYGSKQKKLLKNELKRLTKEWERVLDAEARRLGREEYDLKVAKFVGSIIPGRKDQGFPTSFEPYATSSTLSTSPVVESRMDVDAFVTVQEKEDGLRHRSDEARHELLDALRVPLAEQGERKTMDSDEAKTVTDIRYAITAVQKVQPMDILAVLLQLFPSQDHCGANSATDGYVSRSFTTFPITEALVLRQAGMR